LQRSGEPRAPLRGAPRTLPARASVFIRERLHRDKPAPILVSVLVWVGLSALVWASIALAIQLF
jgi:hypothetical protein